jgi:hypothetical protein
MTVAMTITRVVEKIARCCVVDVLRIAKANAMAPRKPMEKHGEISLLNWLPTYKYELAENFKRMYFRKANLSTSSSQNTHRTLQLN